MTKRVLLILGCLLAGIAVAAGLAYATGLVRIQRTQTELEAEGALPAKAAPQSAPDAEAPTAQDVLAPDPNSPFAKDIPGCYCHSKDPKLVKEHEAYRMNQCSGCHSEGVPTGQ